MFVILQPVDVDAGESMRGNPALAIQAIRHIHDFWEVESHCMEWVGEATADDVFKQGYGFDWWPGDFKVAVRVGGPHPEIEEPVYRLSIRTDYVRNVNLPAPEVARKLSLLNSLSPTFALCTHPASDPHLSSLRSSTDSNSESGKIWLASSFYLDGAAEDWLPRSFGRFALLQPIEAQARLDASWFGGTADCSAPPRGPGTDFAEILHVERPIAEAGQQESAWIGTGEFQEIVDTWGNTVATIGRANEHGLFVETPFGSHTALAQLNANVPHRRLGNGLLATLVVPFFSDLEAAESFCVTLNYVEDQAWSKGRFPLLGNWCAEQMEDRHGAGGRFAPTFSCFIPNVMYQGNLAEHLLAHLLTRAHWVRQTWAPDLVDETLNEIFARRLNIQLPS
jgi:hypothetical protein